MTQMMALHKLYVRPKSRSDVTSHIYLQNLGGVTISLLGRALAADGVCVGLLEVHKESTASHAAFLSYDSPRHASTALKLLAQGGLQKLASRRLRPSYSDRATPARLQRDQSSGSGHQNRVSVSRNEDLIAATSHVSVPGLTVIPDFVSPEEEVTLLAELDQCEWTKLSKRCVQQYGCAFDYATRLVGAHGYDVPECMAMVAHRLHSHISGFSELVPDQITANQYPPGSGIGRHIDTHSAFGPCIASLSLQGHVVMVLVNELDTELKKAVLLPPRSLLVLEKDARYAWSHWIPFRTYDIVQGKQLDRTQRTSLTFRHAHMDVLCRCPFPTLCDSQDLPQKPPSKAQLAAAAAAAAAASNDGFASTAKADESAGLLRLPSIVIRNYLLPKLSKSDISSLRLGNKHLCTEIDSNVGIIKAWSAYWTNVALVGIRGSRSSWISAAKFRLSYFECDRRDAWQALRVAADYGELELAIWLHKRFLFTSQEVVSQNSFLFQIACQHGHLAFLQWLHATFELSQGHVKSGNNVAFRLANCHGHAAVTRWLVDTYDITTAEQSYRASPFMQL